MKKLIKLLNEWLKYKEKLGPDKLTRVVGIDDSCELVFNLENGCYWKAEYVISKRCGFIQRLVDNDKIDNSKFYDKNILKGFMTLTKEEKADSVIMNLSIQNNPINFLISILK